MIHVLERAAALAWAMTIVENGNGTAGKRKNHEENQEAE